jgi:hypothetical protein
MAPGKPLGNHAERCIKLINPYIGRIRKIIGGSKKPQGHTYLGMTHKKGKRKC